MTCTDAAVKMAGEQSFFEESYLLASMHFLTQVVRTSEYNFNWRKAPLHFDIGILSFLTKKHKEPKI